MSNISGFVKRIRDIMRNDAGINGDSLDALSESVRQQGKRLGVQ